MRNVHATALVLGQRGLLLVGPSGAGKSSLALDLIHAAERQGQSCSLVSDDQVLIEVKDGTVIGHAPSSIFGLIEVRGAGIVSMPAVAIATLHVAVMPIRAPFEPRMPPEDEQFDLGDGHSLPLVRLPVGLCQDVLGLLQRLLKSK